MRNDVHKKKMKNENENKEKEKTNEKETIESRQLMTQLAYLECGNELITLLLRWVKENMAIEWNNGFTIKLKKVMCSYARSREE